MRNKNLPLLDKESIKRLLQKRLKEGEKKLKEIPHPTLLHNGEKAAKRIADAIRNGEKIAVVGDYDVDGTVATAIVIDFFRLIGYPIEAHIPNRFRDGYGVNASVLERIEADVIITVDNGITAVEAATICKERGCDLIITDHHTPPPTLPEAYAIVDPKLQACAYPFKDICGAQVIWLLLALLKRELKADVDMLSFVDLLCIAIIADVMPLVDINRTLVKEGLRLLLRSNRPASVIIRDFLNKSSITAEDIAFMIAPRINSAGRMEDASIALAFLTATTPHEAYIQFEKLSALNEFRKETEAQTTKEAIALVGDGSDDVIVVAKEGWHEGVVGIVASRLVDRFNKPAIVCSIKDGYAKGSARSLGEVDIFWLISQNGKYLEKFGGHKMAAGLTMRIEHIAPFQAAINATASTLPRSAFVPKEELFGILKSESIDDELLEILEAAEPYGEANSRPKFLARDAEVVSVRTFGSDASHSKVVLRLDPNDTKLHEFILFRRVLENVSRLTCSYSVVKNEFNNRISLQLLIHTVYD